MKDGSYYKQPTLGLLLWGLTEGNPGFCLSCPEIG